MIYDFENMMWKDFSYIGNQKLHIIIYFKVLLKNIIIKFMVVLETSNDPKVI